eukprot:COSAG06_NODE_30954_length_529_cov_1.139535_1_plen_84_part_01
MTDLKAHFERANEPLQLCSYASMTLDIAVTHFNHVAHPACATCHTWFDAFAKRERHIKRNQASAGSTVQLEGRRKKRRQRDSQK